MKTLLETKNFILSVKDSSKISNALKPIKTELSFYTSDFSNLKFTEQAFLILNNLTEIPKCLICEKTLKYSSFEKGYEDFCSSSCEKEFKKKNGVLVSKEFLKEKLSEIYLKVEGSEYDTFLKKHDLLFSLTTYTSFLDNNVKNTERIYCLMNNILLKPICKHCQKEETKYKNFSIGYTDYCSVKCSSNSEEKKDLIRETNIEKYGHENAFQSDIGKEQRDLFYQDKEAVKKSVKKGKKTKIKNHGEDVFKKIAEKAVETKKQTFINGKSMITIGAERSIQTKKLKYPSGLLVSNPEEFIKRKKENFIKQRIEDLFSLNNISPLFSTEEYQGTNIPLKWICNKCKNPFEKSISGEEPFPLCPFCKEKQQSKEEYKILEWLGSKNVEYKHRDRTIIKPQEIDIFIPLSNLGLEYNGLYYHSFEFFKEKEYKNPINYHLQKTNKAKEAGIDLIHIFEHEWIFKQDIVKSMILNKLGLSDIKIGARDCYVQEVTPYEADLFLEENHIQGKDFSKIRIGLFLKKDINGLKKDTMVSLMTFKKPRYNHLAQYEIKRFCSLLNTQINGAASKLLKYFEEKYKPNSLLSYADKRFSFNSVYSNLGFSDIGDTQPNYFYFKQYNIYSREYFMKHKIKELFEKDSTLISFYEEELTEQENMQLNGFKRIYDCGNKIFLKRYL